jgi:hypothetical protein
MKKVRRKTMAQVTVELGALIQRTDFELFDFDYQVDDPNFKQEIEEKILDYYYDYEIGFETPDMFKRKFKARFLRAIGYYNKLYNTTLLSYNPLINSKMSEALEQLSTVNNTQDNNSTVNSTGSTDTDTTTTIGQTDTLNSTRTDNLNTSTNTNEKTSDYPQQPIAGGDFLNGERVVNSDTTNTGTVQTTNTNQTEATNTNVSAVTNQDNSSLVGNLTTSGTTDTNYQKTIEGLTGTTYQDLIMKEREAIIRIPNMIIAELKPCFILVH